MMRKVAFVNAEHIPLEHSAINALAQWANDMERGLLRLHCGQFLDRARHREWATRSLKGFEMADGSTGYANA